MNYGILSLLPPIVAVVLAIASKNVILSLFFGGLTGALIFFSDLGTPLLVGPVFRPLFDKLKISRQKLAWILDSTSSPVAILIPFAIAVGAVLSGGLFGDHCSPISDTTILSSTGAECDLVEHVKTQLPYALVNGVIAFICYLVAGVTRSPLTVLLAVVLQLAVIFIWNRMDVKLFEKKA